MTTLSEYGMLRLYVGLNRGPYLAESHLHVVQGETLRILRGHRDPVFCVNYNSTSTLFVSGCLDGDIIIWNAEKGVSWSELRLYWNS